jgi:hypothetical protein
MGDGSLLYPLLLEAVSVGMKALSRFIGAARVVFKGSSATH